MHRSHLENANNMNDQARILFLKPTSPIEILANENYLDELQNTEVKRTIINSSRNLKKTQRNSS